MERRFLRRWKEREQEMKGDRERLMSGIASRFIAFIIAVAAAAAAVNTYIISLYEQIFLFPFRLSCLLILCCRLLALFIRLELCTHVFISYIRLYGHAFGVEWFGAKRRMHNTQWGSLASEPHIHTQISTHAHGLGHHYQYKPRAVTFMFSFHSLLSVGIVFSKP